MLETKPIQNLLKIKNLGCYRHNSFWQCVDNRRDLLTIKKLIKENKAPWLGKKFNFSHNPSYNSENHIERCITSVLNQTNKILKL